MEPGYKNDLDRKKAADDRYNPSDSARDLYSQEHDAIDGYDRKNDGLDDHPISGGDASGKSGDKGDNLGKNIDDAKEAEEGGPWINKVTGRGTYGNKAMERGERLTAANIGALVKRKGPLGLIIAILAGGTFTLGGLFSGVLAPFAFAENVTDDLNDQLAALDIRGEALLRAKVPRTDVKESIAGCTKLSIRCKYKTMSRKQVLKYERAGITVTGEKSGVLGNRIAPTEFTFRGQAMNAQEFTSKLKTDQQLRVAYKRAINMKYLGLNDNNFVNRTLKRFGISKRPPELKGSHQDRVNALMNKAGTTDIAKINFIPAVDADGNAITGPNGEAFYHLQGDAKKTEYTEAQKAKLEASVDKVSTAKPPSRLGGNLLKGLSIVGYWDLACTIKNMIGGAAVAAKLANQYELARYAMPILSLASQAKAGDISVEDGQVLGEFFLKTDERKEIADLENSVTTNTETKEIEPTAVIATKPNPNYGKNVMDSPLYQLSSADGLNATSSVEAQYSLGMGQSMLLAGFSQAAAIGNEIGRVTGCEFVQNWAVRGAGLIVGVVAAIFSGGASLAVNATISGSLIVASMILEAIINNALSGSILADDMDKAPMDRAAATWTGTASILSESAKNRGMIPGNIEQLTAYNNLQIDSKNDYIAIEKEDAHPLDVTNQYSFLGSLGRLILPYFNAADSPQSTFGSVLSFTKNSLSRAFVPPATYASITTPDRFSKCDDKTYEKINLDADVQCNLRYVMPDEDLKLGAIEVAEYMETNEYVEADTTTGLPKGYIPPQPAESQGFAMDMLNGLVNTFYSTRNYGEGNGAEYGKFLDYCAYRIMPFGETYEEAGQINGVDRRWITGERCLDMDPVMRNFRIYTFDKTVSEAEDEDAIVVPLGSGTTPGTPPIPGSSTGTVNPNGWAFPTFAGAPLNQRFHSRHLALDIGSEPDKPGVPIYAMRDGVVTSVGNMPMPPYEKACDGPSGTIQQTVVIEHVVDGQKYISTYHHVRAGLFNVQVGSVVKAGDQIAQMGNTGCSFGQHLHVELWRDRIWGTAIDLGPILYG